MVHGSNASLSVFYQDLAYFPKEMFHLLYAVGHFQRLQMDVLKNNFHWFSWKWAYGEPHITMLDMKLSNL